MTKIRFTIFALCLMMYSALATAEGQGGVLHRPDSLVGAGATQFIVVSPNADVKLGNGPYVILTAEKPFGLLPLFLDAQLNYMHASGTVNYNFNSPANLSYSAANVNTTADVYNANLGVKLKFTENFPVRPYLEVGGVGGYMQLSYDNSLRTPGVLATGSDFKTVDGALNFGFFMEAGAEVSITNSIGIAVAYKYMDITSQQMATVKNQAIHYATNTYYGGVVFRY